MPEEETKITPETERIIGEIVADALKKIVPLAAGRQGLPTHCTTDAFICMRGGTYSCKDLDHSCSGEFSCSGTFDCTGGRFSEYAGR